MEEVYSQNSEDYELDTAIGFGSSAIVYIATYKPNGTLVAVKMIELDRFERNQIDELRKEILVMSLCKHENLLQVLASFVNDSKLWIVTPYMAFGSCLDLMKHYFKDGIEEDHIQVILYQALLGLDYLHKNGHIHRDVKAGNLLIGSGGLVKLGDFGVTSSLMEDTQRRGSLRKTFVGTPCWMAPEVMEMTKGYNSKADIWSFGITALEMAYGSAPLSKYPPMKVIYLTLSNSNHLFLDRSRTKHKYSKSLKVMIDSCLQRDPNKRPTAEALLKDPFFKKVRKHWESSHPDRVLVKENITWVTGGSSLLRDLVSSLHDIRSRANVGITSLNPGMVHASDSSDYEDSDPEKSNTVDTFSSQSSWDFDEDNENKASEQNNQTDAPSKSEILFEYPKKAASVGDIKPTLDLRTSSLGDIQIQSPLRSSKELSESIIDSKITTSTTGEPVLSPTLPETLVKKGRFSVIDKLNSNNSNGSPTATNSSISSASTTGPAVLSPSGVNILSPTAHDPPATAEPSASIVSSTVESDQKQDTSKHVAFMDFPNEELYGPGVTLSDKCRMSRFSITNDQLIASLNPQSLPPLADILKYFKDIEKTITALYDDNEALRKHIASLSLSTPSKLKETSTVEEENVSSVETKTV